MAKLAQIQLKQDQVILKIETAELELEANNTYLENASKQLLRMQEMYAKGIKSLVDLETKELAKRRSIGKSQYQFQ